MTITFRKVQGFDSLSLEEARRLIYDEVLPVCEEKGVMLSASGNLRSEYESQKEAGTLFEIERVQKAYRAIPKFTLPASKNSKVHSHGSYGFKHIVEAYQKAEDPDQNPYLANGEGILAMLLLGYPAYFGSSPEVNCLFKIKVFYDENRGLNEDTREDALREAHLSVETGKQVRLVDGVPSNAKRRKMY